MSVTCMYVYVLNMYVLVKHQPADTHSMNGGCANRQAGTIYGWKVTRDIAKQL